MNQNTRSPLGFTLLFLLALPACDPGGARHDLASSAPASPGDALTQTFETFSCDSRRHSVETCFDDGVFTPAS